MHKDQGALRQARCRSATVSETVLQEFTHYRAHLTENHRFDRLEQSCAMMLEACTSLRTRTLEDEVAAYELKQEANKKRELQRKLQELCRVQAQQCKVSNYVSKELANHFVIPPP